MSVKGFNRYDEQGNLIGVEKYDYNSLDNIPNDLVRDSDLYEEVYNGITKDTYNTFVVGEDIKVGDVVNVSTDNIIYSFITITKVSGEKTKIFADGSGVPVSEQFVIANDVKEVFFTPEWNVLITRPKFGGSAQVSEHNISEEAHSDIRLLVEGLTTRLNALANSDDETLDQMAEVVAYIKSNKSLIDAITTGKVSVSDIIDNLTTSVSNKPLSAKQGAILKSMIDKIVVPTKVSQLNNDKNYVSKTELENVGITLGDVPSVWVESVNNVIATIKALQKEGGRDCVTFPFFSDNHQRNGYAGILIYAIMQACNIPYAFFGGDSISNGYIADEATMIEQDRLFDKALSNIPRNRFFRAVGNHDGFWNVSSVTGDEYHYTREQIYDLFLREESVSQKMNFGEDGTYYYVDDLGSKVRFIVMNTNKKMVNGVATGDSVDAVQVQWLQNTALKFDETGWAVVFISHHPITNNFHAYISNAQEVQTILTDYIDSDYENKADVVGWFSGHIHRDRIYWCDHTGNANADDTVTRELPFPCVTITSDANIDYDRLGGATGLDRNMSGNTSHAIDFITINKKTKIVNITRLGSGNNRVYSYEEVEKVFYTITNNFTNVSTSNTGVSVEDGKSYVATLSPSYNYELKSVTVTMGGTDVTSTVYKDGIISIPEVTGDIIITASSTKLSAEYAKEDMNLLTTAEAFDSTNPFNGTGYADNSYISSKADGVAQTSDVWLGSKNGYVSSGWIKYPLTPNKRQSIVIKNSKFTSVGTNFRFGFFAPNKATQLCFMFSLDNASNNMISGYFDYELGYNNSQLILTPKDSLYETYGEHIDSYIRLSTSGTGDTVEFILTSDIAKYQEATTLAPFTNLADPSSADWLEDSRINSSSGVSANDGEVVVNYIPAKAGDVLRIKGLNIGSGTTARMGTYTSSLAVVSSPLYLNTNYSDSNHSAVLDQFVTKDGGVLEYTLFLVNGSQDKGRDGVAFIRLGGKLVGKAEDVIITINEEIILKSNQWGVDLNLTHCSIMSPTGRDNVVTKGSSYSATLVADIGYNLSSITVTMSGVDITSSVVNGDKINIGAVTGEVVITAIATEITYNYVNKMVVQDSKINKRISGSDPNGTTGNGSFICDPIEVDLTKPCPVIMKNFASNMGTMGTGAYGNSKVALLNASKSEVAVKYISTSEDIGWVCTVKGNDCVGDLTTFFNRKAPTGSTSLNLANVKYVIFAPTISGSAITRSSLSGLEIQMVE